MDKLDDKVEDGVRWYKEKLTEGFEFLGSFDRSIGYLRVLAHLKDDVYKVDKGDTVMIRDDRLGVIEVNAVEASDVRLRVLNPGGNLKRPEQRVEQRMVEYRG